MEEWRREEEIPPYSSPLIGKMGCGKSKHDVAVGNTVSQSERLSSESKKNVEANALAKETKNVVRETQVKGGEEKGVVKENAAEAKAAVEEKKSERSPESKDSSGTEASSKGDGAKVEPETVTEEKTPVVEETKTVKENGPCLDMKPMKP